MSGLVHDLISDQAARRPDALAVRGAWRTLSYRELEVASDQIAALLHARGIGAAGVEDRVAICAPPSVDTVAALVGIVKAGAAYVPIDPSYPPERVEAMLVACAPALVLCSDALAGWSALAAHPRLDLFTLRREAAALATPLVRRALAPANAAYVVFTSGSTGTPKGVLVQHTGLVSMVQQQIAAFGVEPGSRCLQFASTSFDASISEVFVTLCGGGELHLIEHAHQRQFILETLRRQRIAVVTLPPSLLRALPATELPDLRTLVSAGEACTPDVIERWARPGRRFINAYGPSECTVCATMHVVERASDASHVGAVLAGLSARVLDDALAPVGQGEVGELYLGGIGLARGYIGRSGLTAERFVPDPLAAGARMYRTGDRVRLLAGGELEFLGRVDRQVKVRAHRIEPGEVEAVLRGAPGVRDVAVGTRSRSGESYLVAYVTGTADEPALRAFARRALAEFMQPSEWVLLDELPMTAAGKVDHAALARGAIVAPAADAPRAPSDAERAIVGVFEELLERSPIDPDRSLFELGADSLLVLRALLRLERVLGRRITPATLFEQPSAAALAAWAARPPRAGLAGPLPLRGGDGAPVWLIPPVHGNPLCYFELARRMPPGRPLYALQVPGLADDRAPVNDFHVLASELVRQIREVQPHGPYWLAGWSLGGALGYEAAVQLQAAGEAIAGLLLIASTPPDPAHLDPARALFGSYERWRVGFLYSSQMAHSLGMRLDLDREWADYEGKPDAVVADLLAERLARLGALPPSTGADEVRRWLEVFTATLYGFHHSHAKARFHGRAWTVKTTGKNPVHDSPLSRGKVVPGGDWKPFLDDIHVEAIDGTPLNLMSHPWVDGLADVLVRWLRG